MNRMPWKTYLFWIFLAETVGALSGWISREGIKVFNSVTVQPPLTPSPLVFPIAWGILYALMGIGAARISLRASSAEKSKGLNLFIAQLIINFFWTPLFFNAQAYGFSFIWLLLLWVIVLLMTLSFRKFDNVSSIIQIPYLLWLAFAAYLNFGVWYLNP